MPDRCDFRKVNAPPAKADGFSSRLDAGLVRHSADLTHQGRHNSKYRPPQLVAQPRDVIHTPTSVTTSPANIATVRGSENRIHAHSIVTGGLR